MRASPRMDVHRPTESMAPARELHPVPAGLLALGHPTPASSRLLDSDMVRFRPDYSGGAAPDSHWIPDAPERAPIRFVSIIPPCRPFEKRQGAFHGVCFT